MCASIQRYAYNRATQAEIEDAYAEAELRDILTTKEPVTA